VEKWIVTEEDHDRGISLHRPRNLLIGFDRNVRVSHGACTAINGNAGRNIAQEFLGRWLLRIIATQNYADDSYDKQQHQAPYSRSHSHMSSYVRTNIPDS
jgi:hypothetical protein